MQLFAALLLVPLSASAEFSPSRKPLRFCAVCRAMAREIHAGLDETAAIKTQLAGPLGRYTGKLYIFASFFIVFDGVLHMNHGVFWLTRGFFICGLL
jgi:hypothetical protein